MWTHKVVREGLRSFHVSLNLFSLSFGVHACVYLQGGICRALKRVPAWVQQWRLNDLQRSIGTTDR